MKKFDLADFSSSAAKIKYACSKQAIALSKENPKFLYSDLPFFVDLLDSDNNIFLWTALTVIGNLSSVDTQNKIDSLIPEILTAFHSTRMITSANAMKALLEIAKNKPKYSDELLKELLSVEKMNYLNKGKDSPECRNVVIGHFLDGLKSMGDETLRRKDVAGFIKRQTKNTRPSVAKRAEKMLMVAHQS